MAGSEGIGAVRRRDSDNDTGLANFQPPQAMSHSDPRPRPAPAHLLANLGHDLLSHRRVALVFEIVDRLAEVVVANDAGESDDRPRARVGHGGLYLDHAQGFIGDEEHGKHLQRQAHAVPGTRTSSPAQSANISSGHSEGRCVDSWLRRLPIVQNGWGG